MKYDISLNLLVNITVEANNIEDAEKIAEEQLNDDLNNALLIDIETKDIWEVV